MFYFLFLLIVVVLRRGKRERVKREQIQMNVSEPRRGAELNAR